MRLSEPDDVPSRLLVNVKEAARMLSIGESTLWRLVRAGKLPAPVKIGSATRWRKADLERLVEGWTNLDQSDTHRSSREKSAEAVNAGSALHNSASSAFPVAKRETHSLTTQVGDTRRESLFLTFREVDELTGIYRGERGCCKGQRQIAALKLMRVPHYVDPLGGVRVPRFAVNQGLLTPLQNVQRRGVDLSKVR